MAEPRDPDHDDAPLSPDLLGSWADPEVPAGFADRVLAARPRDAAEHRPELVELGQGVHGSSR